MRLFKCSGGMTRGRGITGSTISSFVNVMPRCIPICSFLEDFTGVTKLSSEQHKDLCPSNISRDLKDFKSFLNWFQIHSPLVYKEIPSLVCLSTGIVARDEVNCDKAYEIGVAAADSINGNLFSLVHLLHKDKVFTFSSSQDALKVRGRDVAIDPNILWHRLSLVIKDNTERESCFSYELAQEPTSIFKQGMMRKTQKSQIGIIIKDGIEEINDSPDDSFFVIDGGYLLRKVVWPASVTYGQVCSEYVDYVIRHFGSNSIVVFDGYECLENNTKFHEQCQRVSTVNAREVIFDLDMEAAANQKEFLAHRSNKSRLISNSKPYFEEKGICIRQAEGEAEGDADTLIVSTTLDLANEISTPIVLCGNDTDLLVIAMVQAKPSSNIFIMTEINPLKIFKISDLQGKYSEGYRELLLPLHFMTGSDTTSAFLIKEKQKHIT